MSSLAEIEAAADALPDEQKQELLLFLAAQLRQQKQSRNLPSGVSDALAEIKKTPGVSGGAACVRHTRIPVWTLVQLKKLGRSELELLGDFPSITQADLDSVLNYYRYHPVEIDEAIDAEERED